MNDDRRMCCDGECRQGRDCPLCSTASVAAYVIVVVLVMLCAISLIHWINP